MYYIIELLKIERKNKQGRKGLKAFSFLISVSFGGARSGFRFQETT